MRSIMNLMIKSSDIFSDWAIIKFCLKSLNLFANFFERLCREIVMKSPRIKKKAASMMTTLVSQG
nr:hypothetical protein Itr_chr09CG19310 [Ipomoea trifida]